MDAALQGEVTEEMFQREMNRALPPDLQITAVHMVDDRHPAAMALLSAASWRIRVDDDSAAEMFESALLELMARDSMIVPRKTKSGVKDCDIRPLILDAGMQGRTVEATLVQTESSSCKPDMLLTALCAICNLEDKPHVRLTRTGLYGTGADGRLALLETL